MTHLSDTQTARYARDGFLSPLPALTADEAGDYRARLEAAEAERPDNPAAGRAFLPLMYGWAWDLVHDPRFVDPVTDLLGPDVLLWSMDWFIKEPGPGFVSFHQDATYWGLEPHEVLTAWVALSDASPETGPMRFIPGSHEGPLFEQEDTFEANNLLSRGQTIRGGFDADRAVLAPLAVGQMSLHHVRIVHGSLENRTTDRRIGMVLRYCTTQVRQTKVSGDSAVLVAGTDTHGHFNLIDRPASDGDAAARAARRDLGQVRHRALHSKDYDQA